MEAQNLTKEEKMQFFEEAKEVAFTLKNNLFTHKNPESPYGSAKIGGRFWVVADSEEFLQNPDAIMHGYPMREVFQNGGTMLRR